MATRALPDLRARLQLDTSDLDAAGRKARGTGREIAAGLAPAEAALGRIPGHTQRVVGGVNNMGGAFSSARIHMGGMATASLGMSGAFAAVAGGAALVSAAIGTTVVSGIAYQDQMNTLRAVSGASAAQMQQLSQRALDLGNDLSLPSTSAADAAGAMVELAKAGLSVDQTMSAAKGTLQLAAAAGINEAEAATYTATALNAFHLQGSEAVRVADLLAAAANASAAEISDVGLALSQSSAVFAAAHIPLQTLVALIGEMANAGIKGSDAGTSLKTMLLQLESPTKAASDEMKNLGIRIYDAHGVMLPFREIISNVHDRIQGLSQQQRDQALSTIFGSDAIRAANVIFGQGVTTFDAMATAVQRQGAAADVAAAKSQGLGGAFRGLQSQLQTLQLMIFLQVAPAMEGLVRSISDLISHLQSGAPATGRMGEVLKLLQSAGSSAGQAMQEAGRALVAILPTVIQLAGWFWEQLRPSLEIIAAHGEELKIVLFALGVAIAVVAVGLAQMIVVGVRGIAFLVQLIAGLEQVVGAVVRFGGQWSAVFDQVQARMLVWQGVIQAVMTAVSQIILTVLAIILGYWLQHLSAVAAVVSGALQALYNNYVTVYNVLAGFLNSILNVFYNLIVAWHDRIFGQVASHNSQIQNSTTALWNFLTGWIGGPLGSIHAQVDFWFNRVWTTAVNWMNQMANAVQGIWNGMVGAAGRFGSDLVGQIWNAVHGVVGILNRFIGATNAALGPLLGHDVVKPLDVSGLASGGVVDRRSTGAGFATDHPTILVGEGSGREYVIPTEHRYRGNAIGLLGQAAKDLGLIGLAGGGILNWLPNAGQMVQGPGGSFSHQHLNAWDFMAPNFSRLFAGLSGSVSQYTSASGGSGYGNSILMNLDQGGQVILAHLAQVLAGGHVNAGALIGLTDNTGFSTGPHLHFEVRGSNLNPQTGGGGGGLLGGVASLIGSVIDIPAMVRGLISPLTGAAHAAAGAIPLTFIRDMGNAIIDQLANAVISSASVLLGAGAGAATVGGSLGSWISQAIGLTGVPSSWAEPLSVLIGRESGGNPSAINRTDINAILGHPSQGLMQLIPSNFSAYHVAGTSSSILDPVANIAAGIRYILARYGSIFNVQQANASLPPRGYAEGGPVVPNRVYMVGEQGPELFVSNQAGQIMANAGRGGGGTARVESLLGEAVSLLAQINGTPQLSRRDASRRYAT